MNSPKESASYSSVERIAFRQQGTTPSKPAKKKTTKKSAKKTKKK